MAQAEDSEITELDTLRRLVREQQQVIAYQREELRRSTPLETASDSAPIDANLRRFIYHFDPPKFDGTRVKAYAFLLELESFIEVSGENFQVAATYLFPITFCGPAQLWYRQNRGQFQTWKTFSILFQAEFLDSDLTIQKRYQNMHQGLHETFRAFATRVFNEGMQMRHANQIDMIITVIDNAQPWAKTLMLCPWWVQPESITQFNILYAKHSHQFGMMFETINTHM